MIRKNAGDISLNKPLSKQEAAFYIVSVPIGNMEDISLRAMRVLKEVDVILCEDTRVTSRLLQHCDIGQKSLHVYNDHSTDKDRNKVLDLLMVGKTVALVSDAGTPLISDPGYKLIRMLIENNIAYTAIPGPSAVTCALTLSGLPTDQFFFAGFLPVKQSQRLSALTKLKEVPSSIVLFESSKRLLSCLEDIEQVFSTCNIAVLRELTKQYEEVLRGTSAQLVLHYNECGLPKGELVLVISSQNTKNDVDADALLMSLLSHMSLKDAVKEASEISRIKKKELYERALQIKEQKT